VRRIPIHTKLAAALAIPLIALVAVAVVEVIKIGRDADEVRQQVAVVKAATGPDGLFNALQDERNRAASYMVGLGNEIIELPCVENAACRDETDRSLEQFRNQIESQSSEIQEAYATAFAELERIPQLREFVDNDPGPYDIATNLDDGETVFLGYSDIVDALLEANAGIALTIDDPNLRRGVELSYLASRTTDDIAHTVERTLNSVPKGGLSEPDRIAVVAGWFGQSERGYFNLQQLATGDYAAIGQKLFEESEALGFRDLIPQLIDGSAAIDINGLLATVSPGRDESYYGFRTSVREIVETKADNLATDAERQARLFQALAVAAIGVAALATWLVSRSITRPLRALTRQATEMANNRLPHAVLDILDTPLGDDVTVPAVDPVQVQTRDEVADVAEALNTVQDSALDLAVEQAVLRRNIADSFVNLGRRNQNLLGRQLDFITELEHNETDPDTLANLFRLDHLATRMRRNAESLLVLAGIDPPRKWAAPVRITDAIRAALGEVEDYQRVTVRAVEPATILGNAAADLAHMLAELIENSLIFSPPDQTVEIRGRAQPTGYTLAVIDSGLGMPPEELSRANRRLAGAESFTIAPSKYLGHYVAGNLAARHNINVTLHNSPGHGITATINIPPTLLTTDGMAGGMVPGVPAAPGALTAGGAALPPPPVPAFEDAPPAALPGVAASGVPSGLTASGLAKRTPRLVETGPAYPATQSNDDLLQTLAQYASQGQEQPPPPLPPASPPVPRPTPMQPGNPLSPATGTPALSHLPPFPVTPPSGHPMPTPPPPPPLTPVPPPLPARHQLAEPTRPPLVARRAADGPDETAAGLTRRIRGAQLPKTHTVSVRRGTGHPAPSRAPHLTPAGGVPLRGPGSDPTPTGGHPTGGFATQHSAKDVYGFLADFSAGVQRGLDEAQEDPETHGDGRGQRE
jgi:signal transduction histidine kinase